MTDVRIINADVLEGLAQLEDESYSDAIQFLRAQIARLHICAQIIRAVGRTNVSASFGNPCFFALFFDTSQFKSVLCLLAFYSQIWEQLRNAIRCLYVCDAPRPQRPAVFCRRFRDIERATELIAKHFRNNFPNLSKCDPFGIRWLFGILRDSDGIGRTLNADGSVGVNCSGEICQMFSFHHRSLILSKGGDVK